MGGNTPGEVQILPIAEQHIASYRACLDSVAQERAHIAFLEAPPLESTREFVLANIRNDVVQLVAVTNGEVIGWCDILPLRLEGFGHCGELGMGVRKAYRRRGIGERLLVEAIEKARASGFERVELDVFASNEAAVALYGKLGFGVEGLKRRARKIDGRYDDILQMALFPIDDSSSDVSDAATLDKLTIRRATLGDRDEYQRMRRALFSTDVPDVIEDEMQDVLQGAPEQVAAFVLERSDDGLGGFLEVHARPVDLASPERLMGYIGSWFVDADLRRMGWGSALLAAGEEWAREQGFTEMGSDCHILNAVSYAAHLANGYRESERLIVFSKPL